MGVFWALARTGQGSALKGNDQVNGYLLLATSCDGTLATKHSMSRAKVVAKLIGKESERCLYLAE